MDVELIKVVYVAIAFVAVSISSIIDWKAYGEGEKFNIGKFFSAYVRTAWALIPSAILFAGIGLSVELALGLAGMAFGIDNSIQAGNNLGKNGKNGKNGVVSGMVVTT